MEMEAPYKKTTGQIENLSQGKLHGYDLRGKTRRTETDFRFHGLESLRLLLLPPTTNAFRPGRVAIEGPGDAQFRMEQDACQTL